MSRASFATPVPALALAALTGLAPPALAQPAPASKLEAALDRVLAQAIADHRIVGGVVIVARNGEILYRQARGLADREAKRPMRVDDGFRLASMTKPLVAAAVLRLADLGQLKLDDPVTTWLPDFRPRLADGTAPPITLRQLLTHTSGLGYRFTEPPDGPYHKLGVSDGLDASGLTLDANLARLAQAPLLSAPGAAWHYSLSIDVLGRVVEKVTHHGLEAAVRELVTAPLHLTETAFVAPHPARLVTPYADGKPRPIRMTARYANPFAGSTVEFSPSRATDPRAYPSGGAGMVGTGDDYLRFLEAMRTGGAPVLAPATGAALGKNAIGALETLRGPGWGWGLIGAVLVDPRAAHSPSHAGTIEWGGAYGHSWWIDSAAGLSVVILTNTSFEGMSGALPTEVKAAIYQALE